MFKNTKNLWILVSIIAAVVAAATTILVLVHRFRKKKAWYEQEAFDYDLDDCECIDVEAMADDYNEAAVEE